MSDTSTPAPAPSSEPVIAPPAFPKAVVVSSSVPRVVSRLWWLTGLSLIVAIALVIGSQRQMGPKITIHFADGHGLKAGDTLRYRGITVGEVTDVALQPKLGGVAVTVVLEAQAKPLARKGSEFWIERPRVSLSRVSGLETVVGAKFLGVRPGPPDGPPETHFEGIETPPTLAEADFTEVTIRFAEGHGLQTGDPVRHRGIVIGEVTSVDLDEGLSSVNVGVRLSGMGRQIAREGSLFWIERPRLSVAEVRGLDTLVGGRYLAVSPASSDAASCHSFTGLESAPVAVIPPNGIEIVLHAPQRWGVEQGVPVTYRGMKVGQVHSVGLASDGTRIEVRATIEARYRQLVRRNSVFWSTSGIDVNVGLTGLQFTADTLATIAQGGIAFATPETPGEPASSGQRFVYERTAQDEWLHWRPHLNLTDSKRVGDGKQPEPLRAVVRWTEKTFGFSRAQERTGWVVLLDNQQLIGPADVLVPTEAPVGDIVLEVGGLSLKLDPKQVERAGLVATVPISAAPPEGVPTWPRQRVHSPTEPEDVLIVSNPQTPAISMAAFHMKAESGAWVLDSTAGLTPDWHGCPVVSSKDGDVVGTLIYRRGTPKIVPR